MSLQTKIYYSSSERRVSFLIFGRKTRTVGPIDSINRVSVARISSLRTSFFCKTFLQGHYYSVSISHKNFVDDRRRRRPFCRRCNAHYSAEKVTTVAFRNAVRSIVSVIQRKLDQRRRRFLLTYVYTYYIDTYVFFFKSKVLREKRERENENERERRGRLENVKFSGRSWFASSSIRRSMSFEESYRLFVSSFSLKLF